MYLLKTKKYNPNTLLSPTGRSSALLCLTYCFQCKYQYGMWVAILLRKSKLFNEALLRTKTVIWGYLISISVSD